MSLKLTLLIAALSFAAGACVKISYIELDPREWNCVEMGDVPGSDIITPYGGFIPTTKRGCVAWRRLK
jgi:hypothetical protein